MKQLSTVLSMPEKPRKDDATFYDRPILQSRSFPWLTVWLVLAELASALMAATFWRALPTDARVSAVLFLLLPPWVFVLTMFQHSRMQDRLAALDAEAKCRELTKQAARLTYQSVLMPLAIVYFLIALILVPTIRHYHEIVSGGAGACNWLVR
jgi:hypothetical protein